MDIVFASGDLSITLGASRDWRPSAAAPYQADTYLKADLRDYNNPEKLANSHRPV